MDLPISVLDLVKLRCAIKDGTFVLILKPMIRSPFRPRCMLGDESYRFTRTYQVLVYNTISLNFLVTNQF